MTISPHMMRLPYDPQKDFEPLALLATADAAVAMHPQVPVRDIQGLVAYAKANPGQLRFSSAGNGTITQMTGEIFADAAGIRIEHVPYRGSAPALTALLAGDVELQFDPIATPAVKDGRLIGLATTGETRSPELPELPTLREAGYYGEGGISFHALAGPAGLPAGGEGPAAAGAGAGAGHAGGRAHHGPRGPQAAFRERRDLRPAHRPRPGHLRGSGAPHGSQGRMSESHIKVWDDGPVRIVALNRPDKGNAITKLMAEEIQAAMQEFAASDQRVAVLTAMGTKAFSFGADVGEPPELWRAVPNVGWQTDKPLICAVEGWCIGGAHGAGDDGRPRRHRRQGQVLLPGGQARPDRRHDRRAALAHPA